MNIKVKRLLAGCLAITLCLSVLTGCGKEMGDINLLMYKDETEWTIPEELSTKEAFNLEQTADLTPLSGNIAKPDKKNHVTLVMSDLDGVSAHTYRQKQAVENGYRGILKLAFGTSEFSRPLPVVHKWEAVSDKGAVPNHYIFELSSHEEMTDAYVVETESTVVPVYNLLLGQEYFWTVTCIFEDGQQWKSPVVKYKTDDKAPRNLNVDGVTNCRDLGGWKTADGKEVKQAMVYRTARMNENMEETITISAEGIDWLTNTAKVKTEIDFRVDEIRTTSALGNGVNYINIPTKGTVVNQLRNYDAEMCEAIKIFAKEDNYPILFHCSLGTDRTGLLAYLLNGLLGVSEDDLYLDYAFSNLGDIGSLRKADEIKESYVRVIQGFGKDTVSENVEAYMLEIGVTKEEICEIKRIMLK